MGEGNNLIIKKIAKSLIARSIDKPGRKRDKMRYIEVRCVRELLKTKK
jgi:hypothetical protein